MQFDDAVNIQFTSGTTGSPKGATLTHHNILNNGYFVGRAMRLNEADRICIPVPLYHCFGMVLGNLAAVTYGAAMVYPGEGFDPLRRWRPSRRSAAPALYGVPTMFIAELDHPDFANSISRRCAPASWPAPLPDRGDEARQRDHEYARGHDRLRHDGDQPGQLPERRPTIRLERRVSTVGRIHPHVEVKVVDGEGRIVPRGERGELCTRGYCVMLGYWDEKEKTADVIDAGGLDAHRRSRHHR